jgi:hypothetical protein
MISYSQQILTNGSMTGTSVLTSDPLWVGTASLFGIQALRSSTATGTLKLQASCSPVRPNVLDGNAPAQTIPDAEWEDVVDSDFAVVAGQGWLWSYDGAGFNWVRLVYTNATSTGVLNARANVKSNEITG